MVRFAVGAIFAAVVLCVASIGGAGSARADNFTFYFDAIRKAPWNGPMCDNPSVLRRVSSHFNQAEAEYWHTGDRLAQITRAREIAFKDWQPTMIARRYCAGSAYLSDGRQYDLVYWIRSEQGFAGVGWGVQFCLVGRDREYAYAPVCRMLRPL